MFVLGSSGPEARRAFEHEKELVKEHMNKDVGFDRKYTVVTYGKDGSKIWPIDEPDKSKRNKLIDSITWPSPGTRLDLGLEKAHQVLRSNREPNVRKVVYVFVSDTGYVTTKRLKEAAKKVIDSGGVIITIYVGGIAENKVVVPNTKFVVTTTILDDRSKLVTLLTLWYRKGKYNAPTPIFMTIFKHSNREQYMGA